MLKACFLLMVFVSGCVGVATAPIDELSSSDVIVPTEDSGSHEHAAVVAVEADQGGADLLVTLTFAAWVQDGATHVWLSVDDSPALVEVVVVDGTAQVTVPLPDPCSEFGASIEVTANVGAEDPAVALVDLVGEVADPSVGRLHVAAVPVAVCADLPLVQLKVDGGDYQLRATGISTMDLRDGDTLMTSGWLISIALPAGMYTVEPSPGHYVLTVVPL